METPDEYENFIVVDDGKETLVFNTLTQTNQTFPQGTKQQLQCITYEEAYEWLKNNTNNLRDRDEEKTPTSKRRRMQ